MQTQNATIRFSMVLKSWYKYNGSIKRPFRAHLLLVKPLNHNIQTPYFKWTPKIHPRPSKRKSIVQIDYKIRYVPIEIIKPYEIFLTKSWLSNLTFFNQTLKSFSEISRSISIVQPSQKSPSKPNKIVRLGNQLH